MIPRTQLQLIFTLLFFLVLSGCSGSPSLLAPASPQAGQIASLFWIVFGIAAAIAVIVEGLLIFSVLRFRSRSGAPEPNQIHGNFRLETAWTLAPALILVVIFGMTVQTMRSTTEQQQNPLRVKVIGHQFWWEVQYPDLGITTATDLHVPVGRDVEIELLSGDVIHSFWAPELFGKTDAIPGHNNVIRFEASSSGVFHGQCAEFCGAQHANMGFEVVVEPLSQFEEWVKHNQALPAAPSGQAERGEQAVLGGACVACHTIRGTQAMGKIGPDLTHFASRRTIAALTLDNNEENLASWLDDPQAIKPNGKMPKLGLSKTTIQDIVAFLESLE